MKKTYTTLLSILGITIMVLVGYWIYSVIVKEVCVIDNVVNLEVTENYMKFPYMISWHLLGWNYSYKIVDRCLYVTVYYLRMFNPIARYGHGYIEIDKGYKDFDKIYVNGQGEHKMLIWSRSGE